MLGLLNIDVGCSVSVTCRCGRSCCGLCYGCWFVLAFFLPRPFPSLVWAFPTLGGSGILHPIRGICRDCVITPPPSISIRIVCVYAPSELHGAHVITSGFNAHALLMGNLKNQSLLTARCITQAIPRGTRCPADYCASTFTLPIPNPFCGLLSSSRPDY